MQERKPTLWTLVTIVAVIGLSVLGVLNVEFQLFEETPTPLNTIKEVGTVVNLNRS